MMKNYLPHMIICALFSASSLSAQVPVLQVNGEKNSEVYLQSLYIEVDVTGNIATTKYTMSFKNRTGKILEGELLFPLPEGVTISHYALDINGRMREAVPVEKAKATQVFEEIEQRRVDPGLIEKVEGNNFRTRIYPIPAHGVRTISIGYEQELPLEQGKLHYRLPMDYKEAIEKFTLSATVWQSKNKPRQEGKTSEELIFDKEGQNYVANFSRDNYTPSRMLSFSLPVDQNIPQVVMQSASGSYYFVASAFPQMKARKKVWPDHLGIIWDLSLSGLQRDLKAELELLDNLFGEKREATIYLYTLNNRFTNQGTFRVKNGDWSALRKKLEESIYDGGTDYSQIELSSIPAQEFLLFSDGLSTLSDSEINNPTPRQSSLLFDIRQSHVARPIHCVVSSPKADYSSLKWIAAHSKGKFINMNALSSDQLKEEISREIPHFLGVEKNKSVYEVYPSVATPVYGNFSVAGIMDTADAEITLLFGYGNKVEKRVKIDLQSGNAPKEGNIHKIWAQKKISELDMRYEQNKEELTELGQEFGIVTRNTSLIVLETLQDYITYNITPPAELQQQYFSWKKGQDELHNRQEQEMLQLAIGAANNLKEWWAKDFTPVKNKYPKPDNNATPPPTVNSALELEDNVAVVSDDIVLVNNDDIVMESVIVASEDYIQRSEERTVSVGFAKQKKEVSRRESPSRPVIKLTPPKQDNDYIKVLTGKADADYDIYLRLRENYIHTPTFYFDMADWFYKLNDREKAIRILTAIAELDLENASLFRLLGYRFKEYGETGLEVYACRKVIEWRPMEPQSYRDYALALADDGKHQEALEALYKVINQSYARNIATRSMGIEEVVVTELNRMLAMNNKTRSSFVEKQLIKAMPVDIRVVINWNMNSTDIDLHVKDPNGEICYYGHRETLSGGRISNDITQGYGPEQFQLKKATKGKYEVFVNYFGDSQVKAEGPSTVMLEIFTHYSDKSEQREVVCLQLSRENRASGNGLLKVAEFEF